jgi:hypothetical protein
LTIIAGMVAVREHKLEGAMAGGKALVLGGGGVAGIAWMAGLADAGPDIAGRKGLPS